jgi:hypothetical protein
MRTEASARPQSSWSGPGRSRNCVSTVPTEPAAAFGDVDAMGGMIPPLFAEIGEMTPMFGRPEGPVI